MTYSTTGFTHLHVHTEHSLLDGAGQLVNAVTKVAADGQKALAITDHGNLGGAWKFADYARKAGVKPIIGIEAYLALSADWRKDPDRKNPEDVLVARDDDTAADVDEDERGKNVKSSQKTKAYEHITLLAETPEGWRNLLRMVNESANSFRKKPLMDYDLISQFSAGIIALTGCLGGPVLGPMSRAVQSLTEAEAYRRELDTSDADPEIDASAASAERAAQEHERQARTNLERIIAAVGRENVYVEVMEHGIAHESAALPRMAALAEEYELKLVATNDAHYVYDTDADAHEAWLAIQSGHTLDDEKRFKFHGKGYHLRTEEEMRALRDEDWWQTAVSNTAIVAERCADVIPAPSMRLPKFDVPEGFKDAPAYLVSLIQEGINQKHTGGCPPEVNDRLKTELKVIRKMGFADYFLIVQDVIKWARSDYTAKDWIAYTHGETFDESTRSRKRPIRVGPGRGSAAGSAVSYYLGIVQVDPLENNLLFERFLEPGRKGMPDIDVDFEKARLREVHDYLSLRWGEKRVARIGSFSAAKTRRAIKDAGRVLRIPELGNKLAKLVPVAGGQPFTFTKLDDLHDGPSQAFRDLIEEVGDDAERLVALARGIENTVNGESIHACGTLISDADMDDLVPLRNDRSKVGDGMKAVTQWDGKDVDAYGLLKLDVLGLRNLDIISKAVEFIEQTTGETVDPDNLPSPNTKSNARVDAAWQLLQSGKTAGIFQMESDGMSKLAQAIRPDCLTDLSAIVALYRPGPLSANMHVAYADRKNGLQEISYRGWTSDPVETEALASVLNETQGTMVFQEQIMRLGAVVAGFDAEMRSSLRKAMGKKIRALMDEVGVAFMNNAGQEFTDEDGNVTSPKFSEATAKLLWRDMEGAAEYLFNASHSAAYAQLAYVTAYLKANWPAEYGAAILAIPSSDEKRGAALRALREEGIKVRKPNVNKSLAVTTPLDGKTVILGLAEIKGFGTQSADRIVASRAIDGPFEDLHDLCTRKILTDTTDVNKSENVVSSSDVEALIEAGALDDFGPRLGLMRIARASKAAPCPTPEGEWGVIERSIRQRTRLGVIMGKHPMKILRKQIAAWHVPLGKKLGGTPVQIEQIPDESGQNTLVVGILSSWSETTYSKGRMARFTLESPESTISGVLWDDTLTLMRTTNTIPVVGSIVAVSARVSVREVEVEDEEGNIVETVTTKELSGKQMWALNLDDPDTTPRAAADAVPFDLRTIGDTAPEMPVTRQTSTRRRRAAAPTPTLSKDSAPAAVPTPEPEPEEDDALKPVYIGGKRQIPVVGRSTIASTVMWTREPSMLRRLEMSIQKSDAAFRAFWNPGTTLVLDNETEEPIALVVDVPGRPDQFELPEMMPIPDSEADVIPLEAVLDAGRQTA